MWILIAICTLVSARPISRNDVSRVLDVLLDVAMMPDDDFDDDDSKTWVFVKSDTCAGTSDVGTCLAQWDTTKYKLCISPGAFTALTGQSNIEFPASIRYIGASAFAHSTIRTASFLSNTAIVYADSFDRLDTITMTCPNYNITVCCTNNWYDEYTTLSACSDNNDILW